KVAIVVIVSVVLLRYAILPGFDKYNSLSTEINELESTLETGKFVIQDAGKYQNLLVQTESQLDNIKKHFYNEDVRTVRLSLLETIDSFFQMSEIDAESKELIVTYPEESDLVYFNYRTAFQATPLQLGRFLKMITEAEKILKVTSMEIKGNENEERLNVFINIETYSMGGNVNETE
ncbi:MAG: hypothetical protein ACOC1N_05980, partial [Bacillota bacterium]